jgi:hypothetical protein
MPRPGRRRPYRDALDVDGHGVSKHRQSRLTSGSPCAKAGSFIHGPTPLAQRAQTLSECSQWPSKKAWSFNDGRVAERFKAPVLKFGLGRPDASRTMPISIER